MIQLEGSTRANTRECDISHVWLCLIQYLLCCLDSYHVLGKSNQPTAGSFVRPSRAADKPRGFLEALREKYASESEQVSTEQGPRGVASGDSYQKPIEISGKVVEEVGFDKIRKQLAELQELRIVLLDGLCLAGILPYAAEREELEKALMEIQRTCPKITGLDLGRNLLTSWTDVQGVCDQLKSLKVLKLK
ncbi:uncharacterized protein LDX57_005844 [Aspergillus melleus]|uniref:uncharacterized protein n=1 Tax=Aspergillus melleus TaxID=138277 RepID=UPI001E8EC9CA|nr:uncharacterized protein LDX57_005844 [Aspergillus melleus]KAH8428139.1 hypothetical protein LDX57_005844 [Aspergillus melleus]